MGIRSAILTSLTHLETQLSCGDPEHMLTFWRGLVSTNLRHASRRVSTLKPLWGNVVCHLSGSILRVTLGPCPTRRGTLRLPLSNNQGRGQVFCSGGWWFSTPRLSSSMIFATRGTSFEAFKRSHGDGNPTLVSQKA